MAESVPQESKTSKLPLEPYPVEEKVRCPHINKKGEREGAPCDRNAARGEKYCSTHLPKDQNIALELQEAQKLSKQEGKVTVSVEPVKRERDVSPQQSVRESIPIIPLYPSERMQSSLPLPLSKPTQINVDEELILIMKYQAMTMYNFSEMFLSKGRK